MKTLHLVEPRIGPDNAGSRYCVACGAEVFGEDGTVAYDPGSADHTTDQATWNLAGSDELPELARCT